VPDLHTVAGPNVKPNRRCLLSHKSALSAAIRYSIRRYLRITVAMAAISCRTNDEHCALAEKFRSMKGRYELWVACYRDEDSIGENVVLPAAAAPWDGGCEACRNSTFLSQGTDERTHIQTATFKQVRRHEVHWVAWNQEVVWKHLSYALLKNDLYPAIVTLHLSKDVWNFVGLKCKDMAGVNLTDHQHNSPQVLM